MKKLTIYEEWENTKKEMAEIQRNINENLKLQKQQLYKMHPQVEETHKKVRENTNKFFSAFKYIKQVVSP